MYDYSKYENATPKQLINALSLVEKRAKKLELQTKENNELFKFLNEKLKNSLNVKKRKRVYLPKEPTTSTKEILAKNEPLPYKNFDDLLNAIDKEIKAENA